MEAAELTENKYVLADRFPTAVYLPCSKTQHPVLLVAPCPDFQHQPAQFRPEIRSLEVFYRQDYSHVSISE